MRFVKTLVAVFSLTAAATTFAASMTIAVNATAEQGVGASVGTVKVEETKYGLLFTPDLKGLSPGIHGFHLHQKPSCDKNGMDAGGHLDPANTGKHLGPYNDNGHLGDLPAVTVNADGTANLPVMAPRLKHLSEIKNHSIMLHEGGDNYSDTPAKLGGGGMRMECGVVSS